MGSGFGSSGSCHPPAGLPAAAPPPASAQPRRCAAGAPHRSGRTRAPSTAATARTAARTGPAPVWAGVHVC